MDHPPRRVPAVIVIRYPIVMHAECPPFRIGQYDITSRSVHNPLFWRPVGVTPSTIIVAIGAHRHSDATRGCSALPGAPTTPQ